MKGSDIPMEQAIVARSRTGWNSAEEELLQRAVDRCRAAGEPLRTAFMEAAKETGRHPNSVRNHYYASSKTTETAPAFLFALFVDPYITQSPNMRLFDQKQAVCPAVI